MDRTHYVVIDDPSVGSFRIIGPMPEQEAYECFDRLEAVAIRAIDDLLTQGKRGFDINIDVLRAETEEEVICSLLDMIGHGSYPK